MYLRRIYRWAFIGYLVLLLNLVPSVHRAHIFGFHSGGSEVCVDGGGPIACCGGHCCGRCADFQEPALAGEGDEIGDSDTHECSICRFFDEYNAFVFVFEMELVTAPAYAAPLNNEHAHLFSSLPPVARGPPRA